MHVLQSTCQAAQHHRLSHGAASAPADQVENASVRHFLGGWMGNLGCNAPAARARWRSGGSSCIASGPLETTRQTHPQYTALNRSQAHQNPRAQQKRSPGSVGSTIAKAWAHRNRSSRSQHGKRRWRRPAAGRGRLQGRAAAQSFISP